MVDRARAQRPAEQALGLKDGPVVDAGVALLHVALGIELPVFIAMRAVPLACVVVPLVDEAHRDAVVGKGPQLLDQPVVQLPRPLAHQKRVHLFPAHRKLRPVAPARVLGVDLDHPIRVARIPGVFGHAHFLRGGLGGEGRQRWAGFHGGPSRKGKQTEDNERTRREVPSTQRAPWNGLCPAASAVPLAGGSRAAAQGVNTACTEGTCPTSRCSRGRRSDRPGAACPS